MAAGLSLSQIDLYSPSRDEFNLWCTLDFWATVHIHRRKLLHPSAALARLLLGIKPLGQFNQLRVAIARSLTVLSLSCLWLSHIALPESGTTAGFRRRYCRQAFYN